MKHQSSRLANPYSRPSNKNISLDKIPSRRCRKCFLSPLIVLISLVLWILCIFVAFHNTSLIIGADDNIAGIIPPKKNTPLRPARRGDKVKNSGGAESKAKNGSDEKRSNEKKSIDGSEYKPFKKRQPPISNVAQSVDISLISPKLISLTAYLEPHTNFYTASDNMETNAELLKDKATPLGELITPLPLRTFTPSDLEAITYGKVQSCSDLPHNLPVDPSFSTNGANKKIMTNVENRSPIFPDRLKEYVPHCPVDSDPYLPWIHDIFSSPSGDTIHVVAQNKRRCNIGNRFLPDLWNLSPQVALLQPVAVARVDEREVVANRDTAALYHDPSSNATRYRLSPHEGADADGAYTRFICRFHDPASQVLGETLSRHPIHYEYVHRRKGFGNMITKLGKDNTSFWLANNRFECPVPEFLREGVVNGMAEGRVFLDIVPMRTPVRQNALFYEGVKDRLGNFDAEKTWGDHHVLPRVEASGRWANLPVCTPPPPRGHVNRMPDPERRPVVEEGKKGGDKPHYLVACMWTSAFYTTRSDKVKLSDTFSRITEWIEFHSMAGFDHFYIYDNSAAQESFTEDLSSLLQIFGPEKITIIPWPFRVCNNNIPMHENSGERSSQYAAESSCRARYGGFTEWMANIDPDEYLVPMGKHDDLKGMLRKAKEGGTDILGFRSTKAYLSHDHTVPIEDDSLAKNPNSTFLQTYNCEFHPPGKKPNWADRAKKQIYRPSYVVSHFVHYSTITQGTLEKVRNVKLFRESKTKERFVNEVNEAIMIHTKTTDPQAIKGWKKKCHEKFEHKTSNDNCVVGFPWPGNVADSSHDVTIEKRLYNCFKNKKVEDIWVPKLTEAISKRNIGITG